jgi:uncharacterized protein YgiM (DUF1202 family)
MKVQSIITFLLIMLLAATASAERLAVSAPVANIRSGPGTSHNVLWKVEKYFPLRVIEKSGDWYHFEVKFRRWLPKMTNAISAPDPERTIKLFSL